MVDSDDGRTEYHQGQDPPEASPDSGDVQSGKVVLLPGEVRKAIQPFAEALRCDGYELLVTRVTADAIHLGIEALEGACEDCLVPEHLMAAMISDSLPRSMRSAQLHIRYPSPEKTSAANH